MPDLEDSINSFLEEITAYLKDNSLLISAPKYSVTLFSPDPHQAKTHPRILIEDVLLLYALFNHLLLLIQVARVQKAQFSYRLDGLVP